MKRTFLIYFGILLLCGVGMFVAFERGGHLQRPAAVEGAPAKVGVATPVAGDSASPWSPLRENLEDPLSRLLLQVIVIVKLFSQIGVCLFMFVVGFELEVSHLRQKAQTAIVVSHASIMIPYLLGVNSGLRCWRSARACFPNSARVTHTSCATPKSAWRNWASRSSSTPA